MVKKLKKQLEDGVVQSTEDDSNKSGGHGAEGGDGEVLLTTIDRRSGLVMPVRSGEKKQTAQPTNRKVSHLFFFKLRES